MIKLGSKHQSVQQPFGYIKREHKSRPAPTRGSRRAPSLRRQEVSPSFDWRIPTWRYGSPDGNTQCDDQRIYMYVCEKLLLVVVVLLFSLEYFSILPARLDFSSIYILERNIRIVLNKGGVSTRKPGNSSFFLALIGSDGNRYIFKIWVSAIRIM